jgi:Tfp pilus assembly protein FimT
MHNRTSGFRKFAPGDKRTGFSLVEAILVVLFIGILSVIAIPKFNQAVISKYKAEVAAKNIVTCLRRARGLAITNAATNTDGYSLRFLNDPFTAYEIVNLATEEIVDSHNIDPKVNITGTADQFDFGPLGNLTSTQTQITVSAEGKTFTITITSATGTVKCTEI